MKNQNPEITKFLHAINPELAEAQAADVCYVCKQPFTEANVFTEAGWNEVRISQMCEACFDGLFADEAD